MEQNPFETMDFLRYRLEVFDRVFGAVQNGYTDSDDVEQLIRDAYVRKLNGTEQSE